MSGWWGKPNDYVVRQLRENAGPAKNSGDLTTPDWTLAHDSNFEETTAPPTLT